MTMSLLALLFALQLPADRVIGLLPLPEVFGPDPCVPYTAKVVNVFAAAAASSQRIGTIEVVVPMQPQSDGGCIGPVIRVKRLNKMGELPTEEIGYEIPAAVVYERSGNWFRIRLDEGSGWIQIEDPERFTAYANLVIGDEHPPFLEEIWDGKLFSAADQSSLPIQLPNQWRSLLGKSISYVAVLESQTRGGELWFRIRLGSENACGELPENLPKIEGWIPAYFGEKRSVWFFSRGC